MTAVLLSVRVRLLATNTNLMRANTLDGSDGGAGSDGLLPLPGLPRSGSGTFHAAGPGLITPPQGARTLSADNILAASWRGVVGLQLPAPVPLKSSGLKPRPPSAAPPLKTVHEAGPVNAPVLPRAVSSQSRSSAWYRLRRTLRAVLVSVRWRNAAARRPSDASSAVGDGSPLSPAALHPVAVPAPSVA
jgi:hypothetical protein